VIGLQSIGRTLLITDSSEVNVTRLASVFTTHSLSLAIRLIRLQLDVHQLLLLVSQIVNKYAVVSISLYCSLPFSHFLTKDVTVASLISTTFL
jgi:hypothetical protein